MAKSPNAQPHANPSWLERLWCWFIEPETSLYQKLEAPASKIKTALQMLVGLILALYVLGRLIYEGIHNPAYILETFPAADLLTPIAAALFIATAFELAFLLFTEGPDEAIQPLILGVAAAFLLIISKVGDNNYDPADWYLVVLAVLLALILFLLFRLRKHYEDHQYTKAKRKISLAKRKEKEASKIDASQSQ